MKSIVSLESSFGDPRIDPSRHPPQPTTKTTNPTTTTTRLSHPGISGSQKAPFRLSPFGASRNIFNRYCPLGLSSLRWAAWLAVRQTSDVAENISLSSKIVGWLVPFAKIRSVFGRSRVALFLATFLH